jgi:hypothetical protein
MPSVALSDWQNDRMPRLQEIEKQCAASMALAPSNPLLVDENLRGHVVLLSAHFQGYCRDIYTHASQIVVSKARQSLQGLFQTQFAAHCFLDRGNATIDNISKDFARFGVALRVELAKDPFNAFRIQHLSALNQWRNVAAHQGTVQPPGIALTFANLQN